MQSKFPMSVPFILSKHYFCKWTINMMNWSQYLTAVARNVVGILYSAPQEILRLLSGIFSFSFSSGAAPLHQKKLKKKKTLDLCHLQYE